MEKRYVFDTKMNLKNSYENNYLFKGIMKYKKRYKIPPINVEYNKYSKYIRNENNGKYFKNNFDSFNQFSI